jgi:hypothetical protein
MANRSRRTLRLRVSLQSSGSWEWPWETLYDHGFLALSPELSLVRWTFVPRPVPRARLFFHPRVLVAVAPPDRRGETYIEREVNAIEEALKGRLELKVLYGRTLHEFHAALTKPVHILHLIGPWTLDRRQEGRDSPPEPSQRVEGNREGDDLVAILKKRRAPSLVVLEGFPSGPPTPNAAAGIAQRLAGKGIPAVLATQFPELNEPVVGFIRTLYRALATGDPVDRAVWAARQGAAAPDCATAWSKPVLHLAGNR